MKWTTLSLISIFYCSSNFAQAKILPVEPVIQERSEWCWVACGEMLFTYKKVCPVNPNSYQCGIVGLINQPNDFPLHTVPTPCLNDCRYCNFPAPTDKAIEDMVFYYPILAARFYNMNNIDHSGLGCDLKADMFTLDNVTYAPLDTDALMQSIDISVPILAGINASAAGLPSHVDPNHAVLIIGYESTPNGFFLIVNDPEPYENFPGVRHPYLSNGATRLKNHQYKIRYQTFINRLHWSKSFS
jgi:hypothetical protein